MNLCLHPDVVITSIDDVTVLLHQKTGRYFQLNNTGAAVLHCLLDGQTTDLIAAELASRHNIDSEQVERDVTSVIEQMRAVKLVVIR